MGFACAGCTAPGAIEKEDGGGGDPAPAAARSSEPTPAQPAQPAQPEFQVATSPKGSFTVAWRPVATEIPVNELFEIELLLFEGRGMEKPLPGATVKVSAWMPEHLHGMHRLPETIETAPGCYLVRGMMLHMEGLWQLFVDVVAGSVSERTQFEFTLQ